MHWLRLLGVLLSWPLISTFIFSSETEDAPCQNPLDCAANSVVSLLPDWPASFTRNEEPEGSGIVLDDGTLIATADHVLGPARSAKIRTRDGQIIKAEIVLREPLTDIALLKIPRPLIPLKQTTKVDAGDKACAAGNSFGLDISITCGVISGTQVSGVGFNQIEDFIQTDAAVNPGMSGGALIDQEGKLVGLLSAIFTKGSDGNLGVNFAVSSELLLTVVDDYKDDRNVTIRRPGIVARPADVERTDGRIGISVVRILPDTMEAKSGLKLGDIILKASNRRIKNLATYSAAIALAETGKTLDLLIWRDGAELVINLEL